MDIEQLDTRLAVVDLELLEENILRSQNYLEMGKCVRHCGPNGREQICTNGQYNISFRQQTAGIKKLVTSRAFLTLITSLLKPKKMMTQLSIKELGEASGILRRTYFGLSRFVN